MHGALVILLFLIIVGIILYIHDRLTASHRKHIDSKAESDEISNSETEESECCGQHIICEKETLSPFTTEAEYFDDEELDRYKGTPADDYSDEAVNEFREVLMTMRAEEVPAWVRSLAIRNLEIPTPLRDEILLIVSELRH